MLQTSLFFSESAHSSTLSIWSTAIDRRRLVCAQNLDQVIDFIPPAFRTEFAK